MVRPYKIKILFLWAFGQILRFHSFDYNIQSHCMSTCTVPWLDGHVCGSGALCLERPLRTASPSPDDHLVMTMIDAATPEMPLRQKCRQTPEMPPCLRCRPYNFDTPMNHRCRRTASRAIPDRLVLPSPANSVPTGHRPAAVAHRNCSYRRGMLFFWNLIHHWLTLREEHIDLHGL